MSYASSTVATARYLLEKYRYYLWLPEGPAKCPRRGVRLTTKKCKEIFALFYDEGCDRHTTALRAGVHYNTCRDVLRRIHPIAKKMPLHPKEKQ